MNEDFKDGSFDDPGYLYRDTVKEFLLKCERDAHHLFAMMCGLPKENFCIIRYYDIANKIEGYFNDRENNMFSVHEFHERYDMFHPEDELGFRIAVHLDMIESKRADEYCESYTIHTLKEATIGNFAALFDDFLESYCERCMRDNRPFELTPEIIARYQFTPGDVEQLRKPLTRHNTAAKKKILAEYEALRNLDFIREKNK